MAQCPACGNQLGDDFGLVDCPHCGVGLFIEFDGQVMRREEGSLQATPPPSPSSEEVLPIEDFPPDLDDHTVATEMSDPEDSDRTMVSSSKSEAVPLRAAPPMILADSPGGEGGFEEIADFANSEASMGRDGAYHYDLLVSGIDSMDMRNAVKEVLSDQLFLWDVEPLLRSIVNGEMKIPHITAIKAALVVQRMSELPVKIKWVQNG